MYICFLNPNAIKKENIQYVAMHCYLLKSINTVCPIYPCFVLQLPFCTLNSLFCVPLQQSWPYGESQLFN